MHKSTVSFGVSGGYTKGKEFIMEVLKNNPGPTFNNEGVDLSSKLVDRRDNVGWCCYPC